MAVLCLASSLSLCPRWSSDVHVGGRGGHPASRMRASNVGMRGGAPRSRTGVARAATSVLTASRVEEGAGFVRVMGPGTSGVDGLGRVLALDEFFESPSSTGVRVREPGLLLESVTYFCDEASEEFQPQHGVRLYLESKMRELGSRSGGEALVMPVIDHVRDAAAIKPVTLGDGAVVRVVAGAFGDVAAGPPLHDFVMLDVEVRPGSQISLPLEPAFGVVIYILEGVGIFEPNRFEDDKAAFYQNEGHGLYVPPSQGQASTTIRTHEWSRLRFILVAAPAA